MMRAALVPALCLATAAAWSRLELALQNYPRVHDRNLRAFEKGDPAARIVRAKVKNGLWNREQALLSGFALALAANAALVVEWPPRGCDNYAGVAVACDDVGAEELYERPPFNWTAPEAVARAKAAKSLNYHGFEATLQRANLFDITRGVLDVRTDHHYLLAVLCNERVNSTRLFPSDALQAQRTLERYLLRPVRRIRDAVRDALTRAGGCALGVHARSQKRSHGDETPFTKLLPLLGDRGGLFVASDGHSAWLQQELYAAARARNVSVVELGLPPGAVGALAENYALSECDRLVPTRRSSFFRLAAVRSKRPHVRAVWACPATELQARAMASSGATVESCNVMAQCPAPGGRYTYRRRRLGAFGEARRAPL